MLLTSTVAQSGFAPGFLALEVFAFVRVRKFALPNHVNQLSSNAPRGVVGDAKMAVQTHGRYSPFVPSHEVDGQEPHRQGKLGGFENRAGGNRRLAMAAIALMELAGVELAASVVTALRAHETVGPSPAIQCVEALFLGPKRREELAEADSTPKLYRTLCHLVLLCHVH